MNPIGAIQVAVIAVLGLSLATKILAQRRRGVRAVVLGEARDYLPARLEPVSLTILFLWFGSVALHGTGLTPGLFEPRLFQSGAAAAVGALLGLAAVGLQITAFVHMGRSWRIGIDPGSREQLVTTGVFAWSRNPIYMALDLIAVSAFLVSGSVYFLVSGLVVMAGIHVQVRREERFLAAAYGAQYESYRRRVHRYLGRGG